MAGAAVARTVQKRATAAVVWWKNMMMMFVWKGRQGGHQPNKRQTCPSGWLVAKMRPFRLVGWFNKVGLVGCLDGLPRIPLLM